MNRVLKINLFAGLLCLIVIFIALFSNSQAGMKYNSVDALEGIVRQLLIEQRRTNNLLEVLIKK